MARFAWSTLTADAIVDTPGQAANLRARAELTQQVAALVIRRGWTQAEAARRCEVTQPRMKGLRQSSTATLRIGWRIRDRGKPQAPLPCQQQIRRVRYRTIGDPVLTLIVGHHRGAERVSQRAEIVFPSNQEDPSFGDRSIIIVEDPSCYLAGCREE